MSTGITIIATRYKIALIVISVILFGMSAVALTKKQSFFQPSVATIIPANSVDSTAIVNNSITTSDIANNTISSINLDTDLQSTINTSSANIDIQSKRLDQLTLYNLPTINTLVADLGTKVEGLTDQTLALVNSLGLLKAASSLLTPITSNLIVDNTIQTIDLADGSVTSSKILDGTIATADIAGGTITNALLANNSVGSNNIIDGSVATADIANGSITNALLATNSVTNGNIVDGTIDTIDIASNAITSAKILDGSIGSGDIALGAVTNSLLANSAVSSSNIIDGTIATADIANNAITLSQLADGAVNGTKIANGTITSANIANDSITSALIADGTITTSDIASGAITGTLLANDSISSAKIIDGSIATSDIASGAITNTLLGSAAVHTNNLSTSANTRTVSAPLGTIVSALTNFERVVFVAPSNGTITKVTYTDAAGVGIGATKGTMSIERKTAAAATVASTSLTGVALTAFTSYSPTLLAGQSFSTGDVYSFLYTAGLGAVTFTGFLVTIEYTPSE